MSNDLVVQLGAKLDQFASDMNQAGDMADSAVSRIEQSFSNLNPTSGGFGTFFAGASVGVAGLLAYLVSLNKELADMQTTAKQVGLTLKDFQGIQFGGQVAGLSTEQINSGLEKSAQLLNDASRNSNSLSKELAENGISVKNANGQLITQNQLLQIAGSLIAKAANPGDAGVIATMLGFTKEWIPLLEQVGTSGFDAISKAAQDAGVVIDDETIKRAATFDTEWRKSSVQFSTYMKAAIAEALPYLDDLIKRGSDFIDAMKKAQPTTPSPVPFLDDSNPVDRTVRNVARGALNAVGINPDAGIEIKLDPKVTEGWTNFTGLLQQKFSDLQQGASDDLKKQIEDLDAWWRGKALDPNFVMNAAPRLLSVATDGAFPAEPVTVGIHSAQTPQIADQTQKNALDFAADASESQLSDPKQKNALDFAADVGGKHTNIPAKDVGGADPIQDAINSLQKHTLATQADADAVGLGAGALAGFRADAAEAAAVLKNGGKETDAQADAFGDLKDAAVAAADALAKAKVASDISRGQQTALFTPQDLAIANQLKGIYGDDIPAAMASSEAAALKFNTTIKDLGTLGQQVNSGFLVDFETQIRNGATAMQALQTAGVNALGKIADKLASMAADNLWASAFGGSSGGVLSSLFGGGFSGAVNANGSIAGAVGPTSVGGAPLVGAFASGTDYAPGGMSLVGEHGPELLNIPRGSQVIPNDVLKGGVGGGTTVHTGTSINIQGSADQATLILMQQALAQRDAELPSRVISAVTLAKKQRKLS